MDDYVQSLSHINLVCKNSEYKCKERGGCIPKHVMCNGHEDCLDNSDEEPSLCGKLT